jgi:hypothetical protein
VEAIDTLGVRVAAVASQIVQLRDEMRREFAATREEIRAGDERVRADLRADLREGDEETRRYMRVLHEEVIARIALIQESRLPRGH